LPPPSLRALRANASRSRLPGSTRDHNHRKSGAGQPFLHGIVGPVGVNPLLRFGRRAPRKLLPCPRHRRSAGAPLGTGRLEQPCGNSRGDVEPILVARSRAGQCRRTGNLALQSSALIERSSATRRDLAIANRKGQQERACFESPGQGRVEIALATSPRRGDEARPRRVKSNCEPWTAKVNGGT
jgi:hypothetical protein